MTSGSGYFLFRWPLEVWKQAFIPNGFRDIQWRKWCTGWHDRDVMLL